MTTEPFTQVAKTHHEVGNPSDDGAIFSISKNSTRSTEKTNHPGTRGKFVHYDTKSNHVTTESSQTLPTVKEQPHGEHEKTPEKPVQVPETCAMQ